MFWAWHGASGVDDSVATRYSFPGAGGLPCGLLAELERHFVFPLCIGVLSSLLGCIPGGRCCRHGQQSFSCSTQIGS